jgi:hypothetical protein
MRLNFSHFCEDASLGAPSKANRPLLLHIESKRTERRTVNAKR